MNHRVLVTGGAGFLGSHLCERLLSEGDEVICLDDVSSGQRENVASFADNDRFSFFKKGVRLPDSLSPVSRIYHLASRASPADLTELPVDIALSNVQGTRRLLYHARACYAQIVYASTSEIYGDGEQTRSFCYIEFIQGMALMRAEESEYDVYNSGKQNKRAIEEPAEEVIEATGTSSEIVYEPFPEDESGRRESDITRTEEDLGWEPETPLSEGLSKTPSYFKSVSR
jgi:nucleoside-diphosphate-sugar epimerase